MSRLDDAFARVSRALGKPPGWERVVRALAPPQQFASHGLTLAIAPEGYRFTVDRGTLLGWSIHFFGDYEPEVRREIRRLLDRGATAIDAGANVGWHTLLMASIVGPAGRVIAVEPNPTTRARLASAIEANRFSQVTVESRALSDRAGPAGFEAPPAGHVWDGTGRLVRDAGPNAPQVHCVTLDDLAAEHALDNVALVKIDVEGWELAVLRGGRRMIESSRPVILFEYDPAYVSRCGGSGDELSDLLFGAGYRLFALRPRRAARAILRLVDRGGNFLAVPRSSGGNEH